MAFAACSASNRESFAFESVAKRWPVILTDIINRIVETMSTIDEAQGKLLINQIQALKYEISHNKPLSPLDGDGEGSIPVYNTALSLLRLDGRGTWIEGPWLYNECYMYRKLRSYFIAHPPWETVDPFEKSKINSFRSSGTAVYTLARSLMKLVRGTAEGRADEERLRRATFFEMIQANLWGNASGDLSLFAGLSASDIDALQTGDTSDRSHRIIDNDLDAAWAHVSGLRGARIDIVLDNAGFELFTDMILADWLISCTPYCARVVFHPKNIPWFVSDVMPKDFDAIFKQLTASDFFTNHQTSREDSSAVSDMVDRWRGHVREGRFSLRTDWFWTSPSPFSAMSIEAPTLLADLQTSGLVIFKGDLNYRKLTSDLEWPPDTPFSTALGELYGKIDLLALRTCKADVVVGLKPGQADELLKQDSRWRWNGR